MDRLLEIVKERVHLWGDSKGECYSSALALCLLLSKDSFTPSLIEGTANGIKHWWVECEDKRLDPTIEQFSEPVKYEKIRRHSIDFETICFYLEL